MRALVVRAFAGLAFLLVVLAAALFVPAATTAWWQAWAVLGVFGGACTAITLWLVWHDPKLLERRVAAGPVAERSATQKIVQSLASLAFVALFVVPGLDHRFGWSRVPDAVAIFVPVAVLEAVIVWRLLDEEKFLATHLAGYDDYRSKVRHRLVPGIW